MRIDRFILILMLLIICSNPVFSYVSPDENALFEAVKAGDTQKINLILRKVVNINAKTKILLGHH